MAAACLVARALEAQTAAWESRKTRGGRGYVAPRWLLGAQVSRTMFLNLMLLSTAEPGRLCSATQIGPCFLLFPETLQMFSRRVEVGTCYEKFSSANPNLLAIGCIEGHPSPQSR
jgi:hypothetical protein